MRKCNSTLTAERVRELFNYDPETGVFTWRVSRGPVKVGDISGYPTVGGYLVIRADGTLYKAHRLAWLHFHGAWPDDVIDHKDRNRSNNRISNLQDVSYFFNGQNRKPNSKGTCPSKGVSWNCRESKWVAQIQVYGKRKHLGYFICQKEASEAYLKAAKTYHPNSNPANI